ncbi:uncharacterized protein IUM83_14095 [Phytophthora cinnamomi]|uniref:uncharacterized protein n=1 Tax=Phytophthora cinnamomi TaxID=4785 RepID=UPI003559E60A|nr:hypothetical protein IUM83_14095 [Phytophthora cinnamomi]
MRAAPEPRLTSEMKVVAQEMTAQGLKPVRIRNAILRKFNLAPEELPALSKIQRFCQHYASTKLGCNDYVKETRELIRGAGYVSTMNEHESFTLTLSSDANGLPAVGNGSDDKPFIMGVTSRCLLMQADRKTGSLLLHADATFKLNQVGYPSVVMGFSDCARGFHLLALFVSSQLKQEHFTEMFAALQQIYKRVVGKELVIEMVMGDADDAQYNGANRVFGEGAEVKYLPCFYHVGAKVFERARGLLPAHAKLREF